MHTVHFADLCGKGDTEVKHVDLRGGLAWNISGNQANSSSHTQQINAHRSTDQLAQANGYLLLDKSMKSIAWLPPFSSKPELYTI